MKKKLRTALCSESEVVIPSDSFVKDGVSYNFYTEDYDTFEIYNIGSDECIGTLDVHEFLAYFCFTEKDAARILEHIDADAYIFDVLGNGMRRFYET